MTRQQPADESGSGQDDHQVSAIAVANHIGGAIDRLVGRAARGRPQTIDQLIDDRVAETRVFHDLRQ